jgi:alpha-L-arabinofuranosidase
MVTNNTALSLFLVLFVFSVGCKTKYYKAQNKSLAANKADITIDVNKVITNVSQKSIGLNLNFWFDSDKHFKRTRSLVDAVNDFGAKTLRYPGGSKSGKDLWSVPPFDKPHPTPARLGDAGWPYNNAPLVFNLDGSYVDNKMDFDEYMDVCKQVNAEPVIVINCQGYKNPSHAKKWCVTKEQLLITAREWVRYANITKKYNIKYWEIGNEVCLDNSCGEEAKMTADEYAGVYIEFAKIMKGVDPSIKIGAWSSWSDEWLKTMLDKAIDYIDFIIVHTYYPPEGYAHYKNRPFKETDALKYVYDANIAIENLPSPHKERITIAVTEFGAREFSGKKWPEKNDLGHAIVNFDMQGHMLLIDRVDFSAFWNTRWFGSDDFACATFTEKDNALTAIGKGLSLWGTYIQKQMVEAKSNHFSVIPFSSYNPDTGKLVVFLLNKNDEPEEASIEIAGLDIKKIHERVFSGIADTDLNPTISDEGELKIAGGKVPKVFLKPLSISVLEIN